ncbi:1,6-anhydro-N-acetylmuramyl-L-alanine amidase AmpD [Pseudothauera nasutitermitis]|uniref:1,6-anhydro-N-acetylmuramyl-L-alanine amidase AmpD n=1 Tax=Pseudothauera nasutitermitis TaxID=2565930 RepID=A0A4S4ATF4_9RHOO|nr:1,6-anhydro-N-acetylmuramyl-L-alanine amidase AmpD [Pseudothauera nasutitermitis]THF63167.1 1,6-anhydro-N-acetylmuramyl-L-alanine amidase AmpD [Pseudothauera nasutitermitis]
MSEDGRGKVGACVAGWLAGARRVPSPNHDERPADAVVRLLVVHAISLPPDEFGGPGVEQLFTNRLDADGHPYYREIHGLRVSAHFFVRRDGELVQFVPVGARAWHAGVSSWRGCERCNDFSVGIELEGCDRLPFEEAQYRRLAELIDALRRELPIEDIVGHSDIAPGRKTDPGPCFDWTHLHALLAERAGRG